MINKILIVALGGSIGASLRFGVSTIIHRYYNHNFPVSTLVINATGCFLIGLIFGLLDRFSLSTNLRLFLVFGLLGSYTTFSTYGLETFSLLKEGNLQTGLLNILAANAICLIMVFFGFYSSKIILR